MTKQKIKVGQVYYWIGFDETNSFTVSEINTDGVIRSENGSTIRSKWLQGKHNEYGYWQLAAPDSDALVGENKMHCDDGLLPDGPVCPRCGDDRGPSGIGGGTWVHIKPTPPDQEQPEGLSDAEIDNVCLSYQHDFGLLREPEKAILRFQCKEWHRAFKNNAPPAEARVCEWDLVEDDGTHYYMTQCGNGFYEFDDNLKYCPYCGGKIAQREVE